MQLESAGHSKTTASPAERYAPPRGALPDDGPPIDDPFLVGGPQAARAPSTWCATWASRLGWVSFLFGPVAALPALALGIVGWRQASRLSDGDAHARAKHRAHVGIIAGVAWVLLAAAMPGAYWAYERWSRGGLAEGAPTRPAPRRALPPPAVQEPPPYGTVPQKTQDELIGKVHVVTLGVQEASLEAALRRETEVAQASGTEVLLVTTRSGCEPCDGLQASFPDPLMQSALERTRVVVVDVDVYGDDLDQLKIDRSVLAGFFLLGPTLTPRDAIHGGEWGDDIAPNIAPVLGPFVRGGLDKRKFDYRLARRFPAREERPRATRRPNAPVVPPQPPSSGVWL